MQPSGAGSRCSWSIRVIVSLTFAAELKWRDDYIPRAGIPESALACCRKVQLIVSDACKSCCGP